VVLKWFYSLRQSAVETSLSEVHTLHRVPFQFFFEKAFKYTVNITFITNLKCAYMCFVSLFLG